MARARAASEAPRVLTTSVPAPGSAGGTERPREGATQGLPGSGTEARAPWSEWLLRQVKDPVGHHHRVGGIGGERRELAGERAVPEGALRAGHRGQGDGAVALLARVGA